MAVEHGPQRVEEVAEALQKLATVEEEVDQ